MGVSNHANTRALQINGNSVFNLLIFIRLSFENVLNLHHNNQVS